MFELVRSIRFEEARAVGRAHVPADLAMLADHFPGVPVLPGSLQLELCAQIAGPLAEQALVARHGLERWAFLAMVRHATFHAVAYLPIDLAITAELRRIEPTTVVVAVTAAAVGPAGRQDVGQAEGRGDERLCRAELVMAMREAEATWTEAIAGARARVAAWRANA
jgi:3-hydroxymyristoyl/3-hydroxydecanoyl-(acyl carrier protein) dehydratase